MVNLPELMIVIVVVVVLCLGGGQSPPWLAPVSAGRPSSSNFSCVNSPSLQTVAFSDYGLPATARIIPLAPEDRRRRGASGGSPYYLAFVNFTANEFLLSIVIDGAAATSSLSSSSPSLSGAALKVVWSANRLDFVKEGNSLVLVNGVLILGPPNRILWARPSPDGSDTIGTPPAVALNLGSNGCLCINNATGSSVWCSCNEPPGDTLLPGQSLHLGQSLFGHMNPVTMSPSRGPYSLNMNASGVSLSVNPSDGAEPQPYWVWGALGNDSSSTVATLACDAAMAMEFGWSKEEEDHHYHLQLILYMETRAESSCKDPLMSNLLHKNQSWTLAEVPIDDSDDSADSMPLAFLRLDPDGNLRAYVFFNSSWHTVWEAISGDACHIPGYCGPYGTCKNGGTCHGCVVADDGKTVKSNSLQCAYSFIPSCPLSDSNSSSAAETLLTITGADYFATPYLNSENITSADDCHRICLQSCTCAAAFFSGNTSSCVTVNSVEGNLRISGDSTTIAFLKVNTTDLITSPSSSSSSRTTRIVVVVSMVASAGLLGAILAFFLFHWRKLKKMNAARAGGNGESGKENDIDLLSEAFQFAGPMPTRFSYRDLELATEGFSVKLGSGGFGSVYRGVIPDGRAIAVKKLEGALQGKKEFYAEMATMGSIHHWHLVQLYGFCAEQGQRLLVYEYVANGSLDKWLFWPADGSGAGGCHLSWECRLKVAIGIAKGLAYLHNGCHERIVHLDIKPQNVLLDDDFEAKVGDFGLSRFMSRNVTGLVTTMKGTPGYVAPEWLLDSCISDKNDVYSYGMVLLELVRGRRNYNPNITADAGMDNEFCYFPAQALRSIQEGREVELIDQRLGSAFDPKEVTKLIKIALLCIQEEASRRPHMERVVQMLEGGDNPIPEPPYQQNIHFLLEAHLKTRGGGGDGTSLPYIHGFTSQSRLHSFFREDDDNHHHQSDTDGSPLFTVYSDLSAR